MGIQKEGEHYFTHNSISSNPVFTEKLSTPEEIFTVLELYAKGIFFIISGPSGVGKNEMMKRIEKHYSTLDKPQTTTTRKIRRTEYDPEGKCISRYRHISKEYFKQMEDEKKFLESNTFVTGESYGTILKDVVEGLLEGKDMIKEIEVSGTEEARKVLPAKNICTIFLKPSNVGILKDRIIGRGDGMTPEEIEERVGIAEKEIAKSSAYDFVIESIDGDIEGTFEFFKAVIEYVLSRREKSI